MIAREKVKNEETVVKVLAKLHGRHKPIKAMTKKKQQNQRDLRCLASTNRSMAVLPVTRNEMDRANDTWINGPLKPFYTVLLYRLYLWPVAVAIVSAGYNNVASALNAGG